MDLLDSREFAPVHLVPIFSILPCSNSQTQESISRIGIPSEIVDLQAFGSHLNVSELSSSYPSTQAEYCRWLIVQYKLVTMFSRNYRRSKVSSQLKFNNRCLGYWLFILCYIILCNTRSKVSWQLKFNNRCTFLQTWQPIADYLAVCSLSRHQLCRH